MAFLGTGTYPYTIYDLTRTTLSQQFKETSVTTPLPSTTTMAPTGADLYNAFGFDSFLTIQDFQDAEKLRAWQPTPRPYDKILQMLDNTNPQFIFEYDHQNHSGLRHRPDSGR